MLEQGGGAIVNIASVAGLIGAPKAAPTAPAKQAVVGITTSAAIDYAKSGIRINAVCPAYTDTAHGPERDRRENPSMAGS